jgi:hypothetical protein
VQARAAEVREENWGLESHNLEGPDDEEICRGRLGSFGCAFLGIFEELLVVKFTTMLSMLFPVTGCALVAASSLLPSHFHIHQPRLHASALVGKECPLRQGEPSRIKTSGHCWVLFDSLSAY